jgi:hypothetical protein
MHQSNFSEILTDAIIGACVGTLEGLVLPMQLRVLDDALGWAVWADLSQLDPGAAGILCTVIGAAVAALINHFRGARSVAA